MSSSTLSVGSGPDTASGRKKRVRAEQGTTKATWSSPEPFVCLLCARQFQVRITRSDGVQENRPGNTAENPIDLTDPGNGENGWQVGAAPGLTYSKPPGVEEAMPTYAGMAHENFAEVAE